MESREEFGGELPLLSMSAERGVRDRPDGQGRAASEDLSRYRVVEPGDLVINKLSARDGAYGVSRLSGLVSPAYWVLRPVNGAIETRWLDYVLRSAPYAAELSRISKHMPPAQFDLPWEQFKSLPIPVPTGPAQRMIADYLDTETARIDALIAKKRELAAALDERWRAQLVRVFLGSDRRGGQDGDWLPADLPGKWEVRPFRRLIARAWGGDWGGNPGERSRDLPCVRAADFDFRNLQAVQGVQRSFDPPTECARVLEDGDLVIEKSGGGEGVPVGRVVQWRGEGRAVPTNFAGGLRVAEDVDATFVLMALRAAYEVGLPWRSIKQTTGLQNLDVGHYLTHQWPVPPLADQVAIAKDLARALAHVRRLQARFDAQIALLTEHRQALITAAVTGELEIPGAA